MKPGEIFPDRKHYGIFWMGRRALASAFDMEGGFNDVSLALGRGTSEAEVITALDRLIEPFGGLGAVPQRLQTSAWTLENELAQLQSFGFILPAVFFGVAAFILNVALTRALALQRPQIAALKALGYSNGELAWHYVKWALLIAAAGAVIGVIGGGTARRRDDHALQSVLPLPGARLSPVDRCRCTVGGRQSARGGARCPGGGAAGGSRATG